VVNVKINYRKAQILDINEIYNTLLKAFEPYKSNYTNDAYNATVLTLKDIKNRILGDKYEIYVVTKDKKIIGTFSILKKNKDILHLRSMAVHPDFQGKGFGLFILRKIDMFAKKNNYKFISLDTSKPLKRAIKFYKNFGFEFTGNNQDFYGVKIFEMIKEIND